MSRIHAVVFSRRCLADASQAPDQVKVASAQTAPAGLKEPLERSFESILRPHGSEIDGFAARAPTQEEPPENGRHHDHWASGLTACDGTAEYAGRLASRAALSCSGVRMSGSDSLIAVAADIENPTREQAIAGWFAF